MEIWNITFLFVLYLVSLQHNTEDKFDLIATSLKKAKAVHTTPPALQSSFCSHKKLFMSYLFTSESVSEGHPDKVADQISDALIDHFLAFDPDSKVACETLVTTGQVILAGEVKSKTYLDVQKIARDTINKIGYTKGEYMFDGNSCGVLSAIHEQSEDINRGVDRGDEEQGAGDQGMMFGYATNETENYMPLALDLSHRILIELAAMRREGTDITYIRPDSKSQVTIEYDDDNTPKRIDAIVISTQHDDFDEETAMLAKIREDLKTKLIPERPLWRTLRICSLGRFPQAVVTWLHVLKLPIIFLIFGVTVKGRIEGIDISSIRLLRNFKPAQVVGGIYNKAAQIFAHQIDRCTHRGTKSRTF